MRRLFGEGRWNIFKGKGDAKEAPNETPAPSHSHDEAATEIGLMVNFEADTEQGASSQDATSADIRSFLKGRPALDAPTTLRGGSAASLEKLPAPGPAGEEETTATGKEDHRRLTLLKRKILIKRVHKSVNGGTRIDEETRKELQQDLGITLNKDGTVSRNDLADLDRALARITKELEQLSQKKK